MAISVLPTTDLYWQLANSGWDGVAGGTPIRQRKFSATEDLDC